MKKLLAVLLALVMLVSLAACAGNTDKDNPSSDAPANSDNPSMKANVNKKIAMIMQQGGLGDQGFNDTAYAGLMTCKEKYDLDVNAVECTDTTQGETLIRELCEAGYGLIINLEAGISGNMYTVARDYPDIYFVVVGRQLRINAVDGFTETPKNVIESYITLNEHSFLAGVVAAFAATDGNTLVRVSASTKAATSAFCSVPSLSASISMATASVRAHCSTTPMQRSTLTTLLASPILQTRKASRRT